MPIGSIYGIGLFTYIYHEIHPNVGKYISPMDPLDINQLGPHYQGTIGCTPTRVPIVFIVFSRDFWGL